MKVGRFEITTIVDAEGSFATMDEVFSGVNDDVRTRAETGRPELFRGERWWLPIQVALIRSPDAVVLVDTGLGPPPREFLPDADAHLPEELERRGVAPGDVDLVIHTHLHVDHVGWDGHFPNARYLIHENDLEYFLTPEAVTEQPHLREKVAPLRERGLIDPVGGPTEPVPGIRVLPTHGHTPGHVSIRVESEGEAVVVLGDVVVHPFQIHDPEVAYDSDEEHDSSVKTRKRFLGELADEEVPVIVAHLYGAGRFVRAGTGFDWVPISG